jgi:hypothetical protein
MRMIAKTMIALGFVGTLAAASTTTPAAAQGVYFSGPGVSFGVGRPYYRDRYYRAYPSYGYVRPYAYDGPRYRYRHHYRRGW